MLILSHSEELKKAASENTLAVEAVKQEKAKLAEELCSKRKENDSQEKVCFQKQALFILLLYLHRGYRVVIWAAGIYCPAHSLQWTDSA